MTSLKRSRYNNNSRTFITNNDVTYQLTYNYKNYDTISDKIKEKINNVPNLLINPVSKEFYKGPLEYIRFASTIDDDFCNELDSNYISYYFRKSHFLLEVLDKENTMIGYSLINLNEEEKDLKANLICASKKYKNIGTLIIDMINDIGYTIKYKKIVLSATTEALPFYLKKEFYCEKEECPMYRYIKKNSGGMRKTRKIKST